MKSARGYTQKVDNYIGLAARGRRIAVGAHAVDSAVKNGKARIVLIDDASSDNTKKNFSDMCRHHGIACYCLAHPCEAAGKPGRKILAVLDAGLAAQIEKEINSQQISGGRG